MAPAPGYCDLPPAILNSDALEYTIETTLPENIRVSKKLYIKTFGCQMNEYDSAKMADVLRACEGMEQTDKPEEADVILFNTCSIREKSEEKVFSDLGRARPLKLANPDLLIGVGGCVASQEGAAIVQRAPYVDVVFGPQTLHRLPQLLQRGAQPESRKSTSAFRKSKNSIICPRRKRLRALHL